MNSKVHVVLSYCTAHESVSECMYVMNRKEAWVWKKHHKWMYDDRDVQATKDNEKPVLRATNVK